MADDTVNDEAPPAADDAGDGRGPAPEGALEELRRERDALQDRLLRTAADFDNYRKRVERDRRDVADLAMVDAVQDLLPIIDNLERALQAPGGDVDALRTGVELILRQMLDLLRKRNVTPIEAVGADFDPNIHEAIAHEPSDTHREGEVMAELQRGYRLNERLVRPSMVKVARRP